MEEERRQKKRETIIKNSMMQIVLNFPCFLDMLCSAINYSCDSTVVTETGTF